MLIRSAVSMGLLGLLLTSTSCRRSALTAEQGPDEAPAGRTERSDPDVRWVRSAAPSGGDGSSARPFSSLEEALKRVSGPGSGLELRLMAGEYRGPVVLPPGATLEGDDGVTLLQAKDATGPLLRAEGAVTLRGLTLESTAGAAVLAGEGPWALEAVTVRASACLELGASGRLRAKDVHFTATAGGGTCLDLTDQAQAQLEDVRFDGPWRVGLGLADAAQARVERLRGGGATWTVRQRGGTLELEDVRLSGGTEAGVYAAGGRLQLRDVRVEGYDFGVMFGRGAEVRGSALQLHGARRAGIASVGAGAHLTDVEVGGIRGGGAFAGVQVIGGSAHFENLRIHDVDAAGVSQREGTLEIDGLTIDGVQAASDGTEGAGLSVRIGLATLRGELSIRNAGGPGVIVAERGTLRAGRLPIHAAGWAGVVVETGGTLEVESLEVQDTSGPALLLSEASSAKVQRLALSNKSAAASAAGGAVIVAACEEGAQVALGQVEGGARPRLPCVHPLSDEGASPR